MPWPRERPHRFNQSKYVGKLTVAFTLNIQERRQLFVEPKVVTLFRDKLFSYASVEKCSISVYTFMPDHLHMMVLGHEDDSGPLKVVTSFKVSTGRWLNRHRPDVNWQGGFYDHIIRAHEDWRAQALYIFNNPVRAGLVSDPFEYPFSGTQFESLSEVFGV